MNKEDLEKIYSKVLDFASYKPRSEREVVGKISLLLKKNSHIQPSEGAEVVEAVLERLRELKLLSDSNVEIFVQSFANSSKPRGPRTIEQYLMKKGFDHKRICCEIEKVPEDVWLSFALEEGRRKLRSLKDERTRKMKLYSHLMSKGYANGTVGVAVDTLLGVK